MVENMMVILKMERKMDKALSSGPMEISILVPGKMGNKTELVSITKKKMAQRSRVNGKTVSEKDGYQQMRCLPLLSPHQSYRHLQREQSEAREMHTKYMKAN